MKAMPLDQQVRGMRDLAQEIADQLDHLTPEETHQLANAFAELGKVCHVVDDKISTRQRTAAAELTACPTARIKQTNERLSAILDDLDDGFVTLARDWTITYINHWAAQYGGYEPFQVIGQGVWETYPQLIGTPLESAFHQVMEERISVRIEINGFLHDQWYSVHVNPTEEGISVYWIDISERKRVEAEREQLRGENQRLQAEQFRAVFEGITNAVVVFDAQGKPVRLNAAAQKAYGINMLEMDRMQSIRHIKLRMVDGSPIPLPDLPISRALHGEVIHNQRLLLNNPQGLERTVLASASPLRSDGGEILGACLVWNDITEVEAALQAVRESQGQAEIHHRLLEHQDQALAQIAKDLHDGPIQHLVAALFEIQTLIHDLQSNLALNPLEQIESLQQIASLLQRQIHYLRSFSSKLRPPVITRFGLLEAIQAHLETWQSDHPGIRITLETQPGEDNLPETARLALFRIYQEALKNIASHAQASKVFIRLHKSPGMFDLTIQDNGLGFNLPKELIAYPRQGKFGLVGIQERVEAIHGQLELITQPGEGTSLRVSLPFTADAKPSPYFPTG